MQLVKVLHCTSVIHMYFATYSDGTITYNSPGPHARMSSSLVPSSFSMLHAEKREPGIRSHVSLHHDDRKLAVKRDIDKPVFGGPVLTLQVYFLTLYSL